MNFLELQEFLSRAGGRPREADGRRGVPWSKDYARIQSIPTRDVEHALPGGTWPGGDDHYLDLTDKYRKPDGTWVLAEEQSRALYEAGLARGGIKFLPVGTGKTLVAFLLGQELESQRTMIFTLASAVEQFLDVELPQYREHFHIDMTRTSVHSHESLSGKSGTTLLRRHRPSLLVLDEAQGFLDRRSVRTVRIREYLREFPDTMVVGLSGSLINHSIKDVQHLFFWALKERAPLPFDREVLVDWAQAVDPPKLGQPTLGPGVLQSFCKGTDNVRQGLRRRLMDTVGIVGATGDSVSVPLKIHKWDLEVPPIVEKILDEFESTWTRPDGEEFADALSAHRVRRQLSSAFFYRNIYPNGGPTEEDLLANEARKAWNLRVRHKLRGIRVEHMDSPFFVAAAAERGLRYVQSGTKPPANALVWLEEDGSPIREWVEWRKWRKRKPPPVEAVWLSDFALQGAVQWGNTHKGIIWVQHTAVGERIAALGGYKFFGPGPVNAAAIQKANAEALNGNVQTVVASIRAHGTAKNLQGWHKMLFFETPPSATRIEQAIGRMHRKHQRHPVEAWTLLHTRALEEAFAAAVRHAEFQQHTEPTGGRRKLLFAEKTFTLNVLDFDTLLLDKLWQGGE